jgi:hypothetical protein
MRTREAMAASLQSRQKVRTLIIGTKLFICILDFAEAPVKFFYSLGYTVL